MQHLNITIVVTGPGPDEADVFSGLVKTVSVTNEIARRLSHLALHLVDLSFAEQCLKSLQGGPAEPMHSALWMSAIVAYVKCFGISKARFCLDPTRIYKRHSRALENFAFFKAMRNKHFVHDENPFLQASVGAIVNGAEASCKIAKVITCAALRDIYDEENLANLRGLIDVAKVWVTSQHDHLCQRLQSKLEQVRYEDLLSLPKITFPIAKVADAIRERCGTRHSTAHTAVAADVVAAGTSRAEPKRGRTDAR